MLFIGREAARRSAAHPGPIQPLHSLLCPRIATRPQRTPLTQRPQNARIQPTSNAIDHASLGVCARNIRTPRPARPRRLSTHSADHDGDLARGPLTRCDCVTEAAIQVEG